MSIITTKQGNDVELLLTFEDSTGGIIDITGYVLHLTVKERKEDAYLDAVYTSGNITVVDGSSGTYTLSIPSSATIDFDGTYYYDIVYVDDSGKRSTIDSDKITFETAITDIAI